MHYNYDIIVYDNVRKKELTKKGKEIIRIRKIAKERLSLLDYNSACQFVLFLNRKSITHKIIRTQIKSNMIEFCGYGLITN